MIAIHVNKKLWCRKTHLQVLRIFIVYLHHETFFMSFFSFILAQSLNCVEKSYIKNSLSF